MKHIHIGYVKWRLTKYLEERGKNLATKQDIKEITEKIEAVRQEYEQKSFVHRLSFEREFEILSEAWKALVDLCKATLGLRPMFDRINLDETEEERKKARLKKYSESQIAFSNIVEKSLPFYPKDIYAIFRKISLVAANEADAYWIRNPDQRPLDENYWKNAEENQKRMLSLIDEACEQIRNRIVSP